MEAEVFEPREAIRLGMAMKGGPILLVETADCCGGGAAGDSVATLRCLMKEGIEEPCLVPVVDPVAARDCHHHVVGDVLSLILGHGMDRRWGNPIEFKGELVGLSDGRFRYSGGIWKEQLGEMGPSAVLRSGSIRVRVMSQPTYDWADEQYRSVGLSVKGAKFVVVKNPMNFRVSYSRLKRPYSPKDEVIPGLQPIVINSDRKEKGNPQRDPTHGQGQGRDGSG